MERTKIGLMSKSYGLSLSLVSLVQPGTSRRRQVCAETHSLGNLRGQNISMVRTESEREVLFSQVVRVRGDACCHVSLLGAALELQDPGESVLYGCAGLLGVLYVSSSRRICCYVCSDTIRLIRLLSSV